MGRKDEPAALPAETPLSNSIASSRSTGSGLSPSANFGRLRKSTFAAMISQP